MGDGMHFQFLMCTGILFVGFCTLFLADRVDPGDGYDQFPLPDFRVTFSTEGLLGGMVWALGNMLSVPIIKRIGVGLGISIWSGSSMVLSFALSRMHIFGLEPQELHPTWLAYLGAILGVASLAVFSTVQPNSTAATNAPDSSEALEPLLDGDRAQEQVQPGGDVEAQRIPRHSKSSTERLQGIFLALVAGVSYGFQFVPLTIHSNQYPKPVNIGNSTYQVRFFFSQFAGIYLTSFIGFKVYCFWKSNKPYLVQSNAAAPIILSGMMWAFACMGSMLAVAELGLGIGYPLGSNGAFLVSSGWSILYFKEVTGKQNLSRFALAGSLSALSCICLGAARG